MTTFQVGCTKDVEAFRQLVSEIERLASLANDEDQSNHALCTILWSVVEGQDCDLHAQGKHGIEEQFTMAV